MNNGISYYIIPNNIASLINIPIKITHNQLNEIVNKLGSMRDESMNTYPHLIDVTWSWDSEAIKNGDRVYVPKPGIDGYDLTPYEVELLRISNGYRQKWRV